MASNGDAGGHPHLHYDELDRARGLDRRRGHLRLPYDRDGNRINKDDPVRTFTYAFDRTDQPIN